MKKMKIYLDTSVISHLDHPDAPEKMSDSQKLWEMFKTGKYTAVLSNVTLDEINRCRDKKLEILMEYLAQIEYEVIFADENTIKLAEKFIDFGILKQKSFDDCSRPPSSSCVMPLFHGTSNTLSITRPCRVFE